MKRFLSSLTVGQSDYVFLVSTYGTTPGFTGALVFIPLFVISCVAAARGDFMPKHGLAIAISSGVVWHLGLFSCYAVNMALGNAAMGVWTLVISFLGMIVAWTLCKLLKVNPSIPA